MRSGTSSTTARNSTKFPCMGEIGSSRYATTSPSGWPQTQTVSLSVDLCQVLMQSCRFCACPKSSSCCADSCSFKRDSSETQASAGLDFRVLLPLTQSCMQPPLPASSCPFLPLPAPSCPFLPLPLSFSLILFYSVSQYPFFDRSRSYLICWDNAIILEALGCVGVRDQTQAILTVRITLSVCPFNHMAHTANTLFRFFR
jgi:hypothetical protein